MTFEPFLQSTNTQIQAFLSRHSSGPNGSTGIPVEELRNLRRWLQEVTSRTGGVAILRRHTDEPEVSTYIHNLAQLVPVLQAAQQRLLARRRQLDEQRSRLVRAKAWVSAYRSTL